MTRNHKDGLPFKRLALTSKVSALAMTLALGMAVQPTRLSAQALQGTGTFTSGTGSISTGTGSTFVILNQQETIIDWTTNDTGPQTSFDFLPAGTTAYFAGLSGTTDFTVLNRISSNFGTPVIEFNGTLNGDASDFPGGNFWFYAPGGILLGPTASFNVGSLLLTSDSIDTTGGLYGSLGEIRLRGAAGSTSKISISSGATIDTTVANSYVAMVAPRIEQGGTLTVDGSTALVAAEQADLTFNAGLFDVSVLVGSTDANGIVHTGSTGGPASLSSSDIQRVTMVAVAKNTAMTMLLSGSIGYVPASVVTQDGSGVQLSAGFNTVGDTSTTQVGGAPVGISIGNTTFTSRVGTPSVTESVASGTIDISPTASGTTEFKSDVSLRSVSALNVTANAGETVLFDGNTLLQAQQEGTGGTISILAKGTGSLVGRISAPSLDLEAQGAVTNPQLLPDAGPGATGGTVDVAANGGTINVTGGLTVSTTGTGGSGNLTGGLGQGGTVTISANGGTLSASTLTADAAASGGYGDSAGGNGQAGSVTMTVLGGGTVSTTSSSLNASGSGGGGGIAGVGGDGQGGIVSVRDQGGTLGLGNLSLYSTGSGGDYAGTGGNGVSGQIAIDITGASQNLTTLFAYAQAYAGLGGSMGGPGGNATGNANAIKLNIGGAGTLDVGTLSLYADVQANPNSLAGGTGTGGGVDVSVNTGGLLTVGGTFTADAGASIFSDTITDSTLASPTMTGGSVSVVVSGGGQLNVHDVTLQSDAESVPVDVNTGFATGGSVTLGVESGGTLTQTGISSTPLLKLEAVGKTNDGTISSNGTGGAVLLYASDGTITSTGGDIVLDAGARAGFYGLSTGDPGAQAKGGTATVELRPGTSGTASVSVGTLNILSDGAANAYYSPSNFPFEAFGDGGAGIGGAAILKQSAGTLTVGTLVISAEGAGAPSVSNFLSTTGHQSGAGTGGQSSFQLDGGSATVTSLSITAEGFGGSKVSDALSGEGAALGGIGTGGTAKLTLTGGALSVDGTTAVSVSADGTGGVGQSSVDTLAGNGGAAFGGSAIFSDTGLGTSFAAIGITTTAKATGGAGGVASAPTVPSDGNGGDATAGDANFNVSDGDFSLTAAVLQANAESGAGAISGNAVAGSAAFSLIDVNLNSSTVPLGLIRSLDTLAFSATATVGSGTVTQGTGTAGASALTAQAGAPTAALVLGSTLTVSTSGDGPGANPGFALKTSGQPFTVSTDATIFSSAPITFETAAAAPFNISGNLQVIGLSSVSGTGPIAALGNASISSGTGISLEQLSSGGTVVLAGGSGTAQVSVDLASPNPITATGNAIDLWSTGSLQFTPLSTTGGITINLGGNGQFNGAVQTVGPLNVTTGGTASFLSTVAGGDILFDIGSDALFQNTLAATGDISLTTGASGTFSGAVTGQTLTFNIGTDAHFFDALTAGVDIFFTSGGSATFDGPVFADPAYFTITGDALFRSSLTTAGALSVTATGSATFLGAVSGGDVTLNLGGDATFAGLLTATGLFDVTTPGTVDFGGGATANDFNLVLQSDVQFSNPLTIGNDFTLDTTGSATFAVPLSATSIHVTTGVDATFQADVAASSALSVDATRNAAFSGTVSGGSIGVTTGSDARFAGSVTSDTALDVNAGGLASFAAPATGATILVASGDIDIGASAQLGDLQRTTSITLSADPNVPTVFIGGPAQTGGYSLSQNEFARLRAQQLIKILSASQAPGSRMEVGNLTVDAATGGTLGTQGQLQLVAPGTVNVTGTIDFTASDPTAALMLQGTLVRIHRDTGGIAMHDANGGLLGTLQLFGTSVEVASDAAFADLAGLTDIAAISDRLGVVEGRPSDVGTLSAGQITVTGLDHVYIQNTGLSTKVADRRGFSANAFQLFTDTPIDLAINGRVSDPTGGFLTGYDAVRAIQVDGVSGDVAVNSVNPGSTINGCTIGVNCAPRPPVGTIPPNDTIRTVINTGTSGESGSSSDETSVYGAVNGSSPANEPDSFQMTPITFGDTTVLDSSPLVDEPVTSVGNEDLWQSGCNTGSTQACE